MAQMSVPAEPSYKTTSYSGLKGADFSNDPSLVARNHSPDLLNMISDNGGSPIKRKGWEVTDSHSGSVIELWHFQMDETLWHVGIWVTSSNSYICKFDDDGQISVMTTISGTYTSANGFFFNTSMTGKTGFYILFAGKMYRVAPSGTPATLQCAEVTPTTPVVHELAKYDGTGGITNGVNLLTRKMTFTFWDDRTNSSSRTYRIFQKGSSTTISNIESVLCLKSDGTWEEKKSQATPSSDNRVVTLAYNIPETSDTEEVVKITITASANNTNKPKVTGCTCSTVFSQMAEGQVFISGNATYPQYVWYSETADPTYFPDVNYLFVGGAGTEVKGMIPFGSQIAVFKEPSVTESTIFLLNYTTATDQIELNDGTTYTQTRDVYQVKHGLTGIGSLSAKSVFSLSDEPLFLSQNGVMGLVANAITATNSVKNRSGYLDPRLLEEENLNNAIATVHKNYYLLVLNGHVYVLDARQKANDNRGNTSYLYESYYWDNVPASSIASDGTTLWFGTAEGKLCRFKNSGRMKDYSDNSLLGDEPIRAWVKQGETALSSTWFVDSGNHEITPDSDEKYIIMGEVSVDEHGEVIVDPKYDDGTYQTYDVFSYTGSAYQLEYTVAPIEAIWSTPLDNDGATNYFKTLQKKGSGCTLYPFYRSSVDAYLKKDGNEDVYVGSITIDIDNWEDIDFSRFTFIASKAPRDLFFRKKMKKYKRLKIILKNEQLDEGFGVQEIFKTYLFTRYAK